MLKIFAMLLAFYGLFLISGYFFHRSNDAEVFTEGCVNVKKGECEIYRGKLKTDLLGRHYIVNDGKQENIIHIKNVAVVIYREKEKK